MRLLQSPSGVRMSISQLISPHLPYLRRFARALTGNQRIGDIYVQAALESIVADPARINPENDVRTSLYKILLEVWRSVPINAQLDPSLPPAEVGALRSLDAIAPRSRIAFLLRSLEGLCECGSGAGSGLLTGRSKPVDRGCRSRDCRADQDRCSHHRGRTADCARPPVAGRGSRAQRRRCSTHPQGSGRIDRQARRQV